MNARFSKYVTTLAIVAIVLGLASTAFAQGGLTGQISGTVVDNTKAVLPGVTVTVKNSNTGVTRDTVTDGSGAFVVTNLLAGSYDVKISLTGFKASEQKGLLLLAQQRLTVGTVILEVGGVTETVSVQAKAAEIQTTSGERSATITASQIEDIGLRGRDFMGTLKTLPGVVDTSARDAPGWGSVGGMTINGQNSFNFSYDGIVSKDTGSNSGNYAAPGLDSIAEVKVQSSNFQAEYGRSSGASITVVTKSGTNSFRGSLAYYRRNEKYNSNTWDRRRSCDANPLVNGLPNVNCSKAPYRFDNTAWTFGGPVPGPYNKNKDKLFFFFSQDLLPRTDPGNLSTLTMPTALERAGDFSQTVNSSGTHINIKDPLLAAQGLACTAVSNTIGPGCFANNIIPTGRINSIGMAMLNLLPQPNATDPSGNRQYNYTYQNTNIRPRNDQVLRVDYNIAQGTTFYSRFQFGHEVNNRSKSGFLAASGNGGWPQFYSSYEIQTYSSVNTLLHTFSPTTVLEVTMGQNWSEQSTRNFDQISLDQNDYTNVLPGLTQFFPNSNPLHLLPNASFGGTNAQPNMPSFSFESRYPFNANNITTDVTSNLTKVMGRHNLKVGVFLEHNARPAARSSSFNGTYSFNSSTSNPFDTNFGYANAILGSINQYTESTSHPRAEGRYNQSEFFVQDNWRVTRRFTLDYGLRFYYIGSTFVAGQKVAYFDQNQWSLANAPQLYQPVCPNNAASCAGTVRLAKNPVTGELLNSTYLNKLVPGTGDFAAGMVTVDQTPYGGWGIKPAPRVGFAWDVNGNGKTAVRGGFGTFYDRYQDDTILSLVESPPLLDTRTTNFTTIPQLLSSQLVQSTRGVSAFDPGNFTPPTVYNWSLGVQRELPFKLTGDVAYVGNSNRHTSSTVPINNLTYGTLRTDLNPQNADPTNGGAPKDADYLRQYRGYQGISIRTWDGYADYHSIQASVNRRFSNGFAWGVSYTGSTRSSLGTFDPFICPNLGTIGCSSAENAAANKTRNYNKNGSRPHNVVINYNYQVPNASKKWDNMVVRTALDGWQISGVTTIQSGTRQSFSYGFSNAPFSDMTGGPGGSRVVLTCDPFLAKGERTTDRQFKTECIAPAGPLTLAGDIYYLGNSSTDEWVNLGYHNHDITLFKNFRMTGRRTLRFQIEMYNAFNDTQYSAVNTGATFNYPALVANGGDYKAPGVQTNANFGKITGVRGSSNRVIQLGARFTF